MALTLVWCFLVLPDFFELNSREEKENEQLSTYNLIKSWGYAQYCQWVVIPRHQAWEEKFLCIVTQVKFR